MINLLEAFPTIAIALIVTGLVCGAVSVAPLNGWMKQWFWAGVLLVPAVFFTIRFLV